MARVITDMRLNMSSKFEVPFWEAIGIDINTNFGDQMAVLRLVREIYNPGLHNFLQDGGHWNSVFKGKKAFDIRNKLTARRNEFPALVLAHVPDPADLTERMFNILRYYRFTDPTWRVVDFNYPITDFVPMPAPAGGFAPAPVPAPGLHPTIPIARLPIISGLPTAARTRARPRANAPAPPPAPSPDPARARPCANAPAPLPSPGSPSGPIPTPTSTSISLIQAGIGSLPDHSPVIAPEVLRAPIPDTPQLGYYEATCTEAPSPSRNPGLDALSHAIERVNRKRTRDEGDEKGGMTSPPQKKRLIDTQSPKGKSDKTSFTTLSDSSLDDSRHLDADGDMPMEENHTAYKVKNKSLEPEPSVWSTMRGYLLGREPTAQKPDEEL
ncbi:hypothetical protein Pdw03_1701 [Penicillium digitatum]|uniref:Uncharacterized protein n=3 Tax=Penicillium digitatum TaxID=36651 RepID=K9GS34_PEND2|nr:hypothetical protein PDIP_31110 [Penicillium digitatum Pd1]EKV17433.1 hypothetical protein PDIG_15570 [Penicillium digitatum PHI26]EKV17596.1 hypothetical protein PDIP_31110 [Penicillium digitatum Pd1]KAG0155288.1 hypothetical protein PDIDSM_863 [Penicillium digitatum]QQK46803.1 hypothetical protein Pdw03_1701 [Penicillium digitatum]